jgi:hypothetical protein
MNKSLRNHKTVEVNCLKDPDPYIKLLEAQKLTDPEHMQQACEDSEAKW